MDSLITVLETFWADVTPTPSRVDFLADIVIHDPKQQKHLLRTAIHRRFIVFEGTLHGQAIATTILQGVAFKTNRGIEVRVDEQSKIWSHPITSSNDLHYGVETCAGIGAMGEGAEANNIQISVRNELRPAFVDLMQTQGFTRTVTGDIQDNDVLHGIHTLHGRSALWMAGFPCQPWSMLGDRKCSQDARAHTLVNILRAAFFTRANAILLECVTGAKADAHITSLLKQWTQLTGFRASDQFLELAHVWPSHRYRWWTLLTHPGNPAVQLEPFPKLPYLPKVTDVLPTFPVWDEQALKSLELGLYEFRKYKEFGGLEKHLLNLQAALPTALHGWANQLDPCPCGCRKHPLAYDRLMRKGLHGVLIPINGDMGPAENFLTKLRHIHPWELSLLMGLRPNKNWGKSLKLAMAGIGQIASPLQSGWVLAQYVFQTQDLGPHRPQTPEEVLWNMMCALFHDRDMIFPGWTTGGIPSDFMQSAHGSLMTLSQSRLVPPSIPDEPSEESRISVARTEVTTIPNDEVVAGGVTPEPVHNTPRIESLIPAELSTPGSRTSSVVEPSRTPENDFGLWEEHERRSHANHRSQQFQLDIEHWNKTGGVPGFANTEVEEVHPNKKQRIVHMGLPEASGREDPPGVCHTSERLGHHSGQPWASGAVEVASRDSSADSNVGASDEGGSTEPKRTDPIKLQQSDTVLPVWLITNPIDPPICLKVSKGATVRELEIAEQRLTHGDRTIPAVHRFGHLLQPDDSLYSGQLIHMQPLQKQSAGGNFEGPPLCFSQTRPTTRMHLLRQQMGWMAQDEFEFHLQRLACKCEVSWHKTFPTLTGGPRHAFEQELTMWIDNLLENFPISRVVITAFLCDNHWIPLVIGADATKRIYTTTQGIQILNRLQPNIADNWNLHSIVLPSIFRADCGFQAVGWISKFLTCSGRQHVNLETAEQWRKDFIAHLAQHDGLATLIAPNTLLLGGMGAPDQLESQLQNLLEQHGVPKQASTQRTNHVLEHLGRQAVTSILRSQRPWKDLKARANLHNPKIQLVMAEELDQVIKNRVANGTPFGQKRQKKPQTTLNPTIKLQAEDLEIPCGIFCEDTDTLLSQIPLGSVGPEAQGIIVCNIKEATPFLKLQKPVSKHGLALLILDHEADLLQDHGHLTRFPATCVRTGEPLLASAKLVQIGNIPVVRNEPQHKYQIEEEVTEVVRVLAFRDELSINWSEFMQNPVKQLIQWIPALTPQDPTVPHVIDVWDRQWVTAKMDRIKQSDAFTFIVTFRVVHIDLKTLLAESGKNGIYLEPRTPDGRTPNPNWRVLRLPHTDKQHAQTAVQTSEQWACIVRSGNRFGIRSTSQEAQALHSIHKPGTPFLDTAHTLQFTAGPFPFGTTKQALVKVFALWEWNARPLQPKARSIDGSGVIWGIQASKKPPFSIYQMKHGDVLIAEIPPKKAIDEQQSHGVVASTKTIAALQHHQPKQDTAPVDPWNQNDPWQNWQPSKSVRITPQAPVKLDKSQLETIENAITTKLKADLHKHQGEDESMEMGTSDRVALLEDRLNKVEHVMQQTAVSQQQQHEALDKKVDTIRSQMEQSHQNFHQVLDQRFNEQLGQIERLLAKKPRAE